MGEMGHQPQIGGAKVRTHVGGRHKTDEDLLREAMSGDMDSYTELFLRHWKHFFQAALKITHSEPEAEDAVMVAYYEVYKAIIKMNDPVDFDFEAYVSTAVRHNAGKAAKRMTTEIPTMSEDLEEATMEAHDQADSVEWSNMCTDDLHKDIRKAYRKGDDARVAELSEELRRWLRPIKKPDEGI